MRYYNNKLETYLVFQKNEQYPFSLEGLVIPVSNGDLLATFTTGGTAEPRVENITVLARSSDRGRTWSKPITLFSHSSKGVFSTVLYERKGVIRIYLNTYRNDTHFAEDMQSYYSESYDGGLTFSTPHSLPGCINNVHIKQAVWNGERLFLPFSWREIEGEEWCVPTKQLGSKTAMVCGKASKQTLLPDDASMHDCFREWHRWGFENTNEYIGVMVSDDDGKTYNIRGRINSTVRHLCEPTLAVLKDGTLLMYIRSNVEKALFSSRSTDGGETWSELERLDIPTPITKVRLYSRSNGDLLLLHNPSMVSRSPLSLWISHDQGLTWAEKTDLVSDTESPIAYPDGFIDEESGCLCFTWDDRQNVYFSKWNL